ncbi:hypothetical protein [Haliangium ochraceum]|nr:hypothetical protein [Haliangium ochraceum]
MKTMFRVALPALLLGVSLALGACMLEEVPEADTAASEMLESADFSSAELSEAAADEFGTEDVCPREWLCGDDGAVYPLKAQCEAACSVPCDPEYVCDGTCICP